MITSILVWLVVGLIAGALASLVMRGGGYGIIGDIVVGLVGAIIGGLLAGLVGIGTSNIVGQILIAFVGACILIAILRAVSGGFGRRV
jgi:Transglycosylase associated protein.